MTISEKEHNTIANLTKMKIVYNIITDINYEDIKDIMSFDDFNSLRKSTFNLMDKLWNKSVIIEEKE